MQTVLCTCPQANGWHNLASAPSEPFVYELKKFVVDVVQSIASFLHALKAAHEMSLRHHCHHHCRHAVTCDLDFEDNSKYRQAVDA